nr:MAG TPA: hypothetical protein [Caudoviricetes sp.]
MLPDQSEQLLTKKSEGYPHIKYSISGYSSQLKIGGILWNII